MEQAPQNEELLNYIRRARESGMADNEIRQELFQNGWLARDITAALSEPQSQQAAYQIPPQEPRHRKFPTRLVVYPLLLLLVAIAAPNIWPYVEDRFGPSPKADRASVENPSGTPAATPQSPKATPPSSPVPAAGAVSPAPVPSATYRNTLFKFEASYKAPWRVAPDISRGIAAAQYAAPVSGSEIGEAEEKKFGEYFLNWTAEKSELIVLTDMSATEERAFIDQVRAGAKTLLDLPPERWIQIGPVPVVTDPAKGTPPTSRGGITLKTITLADGTKALELDSRATPSGELSILIPHAFSAKLGSGDVPKSIEVRTSISMGSVSEKIFYDIANSLRFL